ncbi:RAD52 motif-containing protein 1 isoform X4 [Octodon degus]|uniref:RAD52 motif-containing protein 1 isoform X4 n=1 Tax=Octodon degus TaxID=10160 RepID=A0A6P6ENW1_OCTDE|nr:RAD52 motif-containing protein 1 isoform X4 [Octodon degus]
MAELIPFAVPSGSDKTLLVWNLSSGPTAEALHVHLGSRHKAAGHQTLPLNSSRCQELANYYFGFNGWSKRIIKLQDLSDLEGRDAGALATPRGKPGLRFLCALEVVLPSYKCASPGVAVAEESVEELEQGQLLCLRAAQPRGGRFQGFQRGGGRTRAPRAGPALDLGAKQPSPLLPLSPSPTWPQTQACIRPYWRWGRVGLVTVGKAFPCLASHKPIWLQSKYWFCKQKCHK